MSASRCIILVAAACLLADCQPAPHRPIRTPVLIRFDAAEVDRLGRGEMSFDALRPRLLEGMGLPPDTMLGETVVSRLLREKSGGPVDFSRWMVLYLELPPRRQDLLDAAVHRLTETPLVLDAEPDYDAYGWKPAENPVAAGQAAKADDALVPNDPLFSLQYYHHVIRTPRAWRITTGSADVTVALLDSGCEEIDELAGRIVRGYDFVPGASKNGDALGHGTSIAALIAAKGNNAVGIAGMDWACRILPMNAVQGGIAVWTQAIEYAVYAGAKVVNISGKLSLPDASPRLETALEQAVAAGVVVVASAGNQNQPRLAWPAASPNVIAVGAVDGVGQRWQNPALGLGSNWGPGLDLVAPGKDIITLGQDGRQTSGEGTSVATALVSGACALMVAVNPALTPAQMRQILRDTADKIGPQELWSDGYSQTFGYGRLNVYEAVREAQRLANP